MIPFNLIPNLLIRSLLIFLLVLSFASLYAATATNTVPTTGLSEQTEAVSVNDLKPPECSSLSLSVMLTGGGTIDGTVSNELVLGSALADDINARNGDDCVVAGDGNDILDGAGGTDVLIGGSGDDSLYGGAGADVLYGNENDDTLRGEGGNDVLYGGDGNDTLIGGAGYDQCFGGNGVDTFVSCETIVDP